MKIKNIRYFGFVCHIHIILIIFFFNYQSNSIQALPSKTLKRCHTFHYQDLNETNENKEVLLPSNQIEIINSNINEKNHIKPKVIQKNQFWQFLHQFLHFGMDIIEMTNEIISN